MFLNWGLLSLEYFYAPFVLILEDAWLLLVFNTWPELKAERLSGAPNCCIVNGPQSRLSSSLKDAEFSVWWCSVADN